MGEEPPTKWTNSELRVRLQELEEEKGIVRAHGKVRTSHQSWMVRLGKANKKKNDLVVFCQNDLQLHLEWTETVPQLEKKAVEKDLCDLRTGRSRSNGLRGALPTVLRRCSRNTPAAVRTMMEGSRHPRLERFAHWRQSQKEKNEELLPEIQYVKKKGMTSTSDKGISKVTSGYPSKPKAKSAPAASGADLSDVEDDGHPHDFEGGCRGTQRGAPTQEEREVRGRLHHGVGDGVGGHRSLDLSETPSTAKVSTSLGHFMEQNIGQQVQDLVQKKTILLEVACAPTSVLSQVVQQSAGYPEAASTKLTY